MGEQSDPLREMEARRRPRSSHAQHKRTEAAGRAPLATAMATGAATRRAARDEVQPSVDRAAIQRAACMNSEGVFCV